MDDKTFLSQKAEPAAWLTVAQVARAIGLTPQGVYGVIKRGKLDAYRFGGAYRIPAAAFAAFMERSRCSPAAPEAARVDECGCSECVCAAAPEAAGSEMCCGAAALPANDLDSQHSFSFADDPGIVEGEYTAFEVRGAQHASTASLEAF